MINKYIKVEQGSYRNQDMSGSRQHSKTCYNTIYHLNKGGNK